MGKKGSLILSAQPGEGGSLDNDLRFVVVQKKKKQHPCHEEINVIPA